MPTVEGRVDKVIHRSDAFVILALKALLPNSDKPTIVRLSGHLHGVLRVCCGVPLRVSGEWRDHPKYGRQIAFTGWSPWAETSGDVARFLHECVEGFADWDLAELVAGTFGVSAYDVLTDQPEKVRELAEPETDLRAALDRAVLGWASGRSVSSLAALFQDIAIGPDLVQTAIREFGSDAVARISQNPYRLVAINGFSFEHADRLALRLGVPQNDVRRIEGAVLWSLHSEARNGHLYVHRDELSRVFGRLLPDSLLESFGDPSTVPLRLSEAVDQLAAAGTVVLDGPHVYLPSFYGYERQSAVKLAGLLGPSTLEVNLDEFLADYQKSHRIELSEIQKEAVCQLVKNRVLVLTGLPGTGKTTVTKAFVRLFQAAGNSFMLMAPTGVAAKRLAAVVGVEAMTIHRALQCDGHSWRYNKQRQLTVDAVIVDELSMVDQELFFRILDALRPDSMLVLVGDDAQLPSVSPGNVLRELVHCPQIPRVRLTQIFRQSDRSDIVVASHKIQRGESPLKVGVDRTSEFQFVHLLEESQIAALIVEMAARLKGKDANFQVLSPKYAGTVGVDNLNNLLREKLNPDEGQRYCQIGALHVRVGDRLTVLQNDYVLNIYNGDMCKLAGIEKDDLLVRVHGVAGSVEALVTIPKKDAPALLKLAYAVTVHRCQGSEFGTIILPIVSSQGRMLHRNLFYTAVTRARQKVWLLGDPVAVQKAVENDQVIRRNTALAKAISDAVTKPSDDRCTVDDESFPGPSGENT